RRQSAPGHKSRTRKVWPVFSSGHPRGCPFCIEEPLRTTKLRRYPKDLVESLAMSTSPPQTQPALSTTPCLDRQIPFPRRNPADRELCCWACCQPDHGILCV